jgi:hypothetical protein
MTGRTCDGPHPYPGPGHPWPEGKRCYCQRCETAGIRWAWSLPEMTQEVGRSGRCRLGHLVTALADTAAARLYTARIPPDDPGLMLLREWNATALVRSAVSGIASGAKPDTPGRRANGEPAGTLREHGPDLFPALAKELPRTNESAPQLGSASQLNPTEPVAQNGCEPIRYRALQHNQESR